MSIRLSKSDISSFVGAVLPLRLLGVTEYGKDPVFWSVEGDCVLLETFEGSEEGDFTDGVLLTLVSTGEAVVTAEFEGGRHSCRISARAAEHTPSGKGLSYFLGDFHDHTQKTHDEALFVKREEFIPYDAMKQLCDEGILDFSVVSDHAGLLNKREYFRGFWDAFRAEEELGYISLPGSEAEVSPLEADRYGVIHKVGGEIVTVNAAGFANCDGWEEFFARYETSPFAISVLAHPQISGISTKGIWNFKFHENNSPRFREMVKGVEMGNGTTRKSTLLYEYAYSLALDNGFFLAPTCSSDCHGPVWSASICPGKTVIMATKKSREAFMDALASRRFYATESGNVRLYYEVNGSPAPARLSPDTKYHFHVEISLFAKEKGGMPTRLQVVSDYGKTVFETKDVKEVMDFTIESDSARYFYLRLMDEIGQKTWSCPVLTGREMDGVKKAEYVPLDKKGFVAVEEGGRDASCLFSDDPNRLFFGEKKEVSILLDMGEEKKFSSVGIYPMTVDGSALKSEGVKLNERIAAFPRKFVIEAGVDVQNLTEVVRDELRVFGAEEIFSFGETSARYLKLSILSTVGSESGRPEFADTPPILNEITLYE